jgi:hypothetical protein
MNEEMNKKKFDRKLQNFEQLAMTPGACIIKRITAVIYGFRNKLECLSLASLSCIV